MHLQPTHAPRVLAVCLNPALDVTYEIDQLRYGATHRVRRVHRRPGGKGVNVARVLAQLGVPATVAGFLGGATGREIDAALTASGFETRWVRIEGESRRCVAVVETGAAAATEFNEPGPEIPPPAWQFFLAQCEEWLRQDDFAVVIFSGSLPPGVPPDAYARLIRLARRAGVPAVLDTSGEALRLGLAAAPSLIKPNRDELDDLAKEADRESGGAREIAGVACLAEQLRTGGPESVVVSLGADGLVAATSEGTWWARAPEMRGNPVGAGDALVAALVDASLRGWSWPERLSHAAAVAAAAVAAPAAGEFRNDVYPELRGGVRVERIL